LTFDELKSSALVQAYEDKFDSVFLKYLYRAPALQAGSDVYRIDEPFDSVYGLVVASLEDEKDLLTPALSKMTEADLRRNGVVW